MQSQSMVILYKGEQKRQPIKIHIEYETNDHMKALHTKNRSYYCWSYAYDIIHVFIILAT